MKSLNSGLHLCGEFKVGGGWRLIYSGIVNKSPNYSEKGFTIPHALPIEQINFKLLFQGQTE